MKQWTEDRFFIFIVVLAEGGENFFTVIRPIKKVVPDMVWKDEHLILRECDFRDTEYKLQ